MDKPMQYEKFLRERITELRGQKGISEHRLSLELGKSGSYIRAITSGAALPSTHELFNLMDYFEVTPVEFFGTLENATSLRASLLEALRELSDEDLEKVALFLRWIQK